MLSLLTPDSTPSPKELLTFGQGDPTGVIAGLLAQNSLYTVAQPIVDLTKSDVYAHEALIRGPVGGKFHSPDALLKMAAYEDYLVDFEVACVVRALNTWKEVGNGGRVFINLSASALASTFNGHSSEEISQVISAYGVAPRSIVFEITEHEHISDVPNLIAIARILRQTGVRFALDDFGDGRSSLRLWAELEPDYVKIDKYFTRDISTSATKIKTIRSLMQLADNFDAMLIAEGIETAEDLHVLRDMGIEFGQGYFLGRPEREPLYRVNTATGAVLSESRVSILPLETSSTSKITLRDSMVLKVTPVNEDTPLAEVIQLFVEHPNWHAIPVLRGDRPVAIIGRHELLTQSAKPYFAELFGKKSCMRYANQAPRKVENNQDVRDLIGILTSVDQRYLTEGFIYTENGRYAGIGMGEHLVRMFTESRIEAARHANPLTFLPGNVPISEHVSRLIERGGHFCLAYADLANFKAYNDVHGYHAGDEAIKLVASTFMKFLDRKQDFLGHIGGDDFIAVFQSEDWHERLSGAIADFNESAKSLYTEAEKIEGGIWAEDRHGISRFFGFTSLYAGVVDSGSAHFRTASDISGAAARARQQAKRESVTIYVSKDVPGTFDDFKDLTALML